jgi:hypothetical protein
VAASIATKLVAESEAKGSSTRGGSGRGNSSKSSITIFSFWRHWLLRDHILALAGVTAPSEYGLERLKIPPEEEEEVAGGGATVPEHLEWGAAEVEGTSMVITRAAGNWGLRSVISLSLMKSMPMTFSIIIIIYGA